MGGLYQPKFEIGELRSVARYSSRVGRGTSKGQKSPDCSTHSAGEKHGFPSRSEQPYGRPHPWEALVGPGVKDAPKKCGSEWWTEWEHISHEQQGSQPISNGTGHSLLGRDRPTAFPNVQKPTWVPSISETFNVQSHLLIDLLQTDIFFSACAVTLKGDGGRTANTLLLIISVCHTSGAYPMPSVNLALIPGVLP